MLELPSTASADEIKRAFRLQIARYHPDKVQHLGKEFQALAAERATTLTEAFRILGDAARRVEYDRTLSDGAPAEGTAAAPPAHGTPPSPDVAVPTPSPAGEPAQRAGGQFAHERATRDEYVRKATVSRFRQAFDGVGKGYEESSVAGFDMAWLPRNTLFARNSGPRFLVRFVPNVDGAAVADAWLKAGRWGADHEVCVFLVGPGLAPASELGKAIAEQRRTSRTAKVTLIPMDGGTWDAHMPTDAPAIAKSVLARLKGGPK